MLLFLVSTVHGQTSRINELPSFVVVAEDSCALPKISDEELWQKAIKVTFPVNQTYINPGDTTIQHIVEVIKTFSNDYAFSRLLVIRGSASPEGPADNNKRLAHQRAHAIIDTLRHYFSIPDSIISEQYIDEDYQGLRRLVAVSDYPYKEQVLTTIDSFTDTRKLKAKLKSLNGGRIWKDLLRNFYPQLRATRVVIFVSRKRHEQPATNQTKQEPKPILPDTNVKQESISNLTEPIPPRRELLSVKTNLLFYGAWIPNYGYCPIPNIEIEYYPLRGHWTFGASFDMPWWQSSAYNDHTETSTGKNHKFFQVRQYQLLARWYSHDGGSADGFHGFYIQPYINLAIFGIGFKWDKGWMGEGLGAGAGIGYKLPLGRLRDKKTGFRTHASHWHLEFVAQFGAFAYQYDPYQYGCPKDGTVDGRYYYRYRGDASHFHKRDHHRAWFGPTRIGITLSYDILYRSRKHSNKKGGEL